MTAQEQQLADKWFGTWPTDRLVAVVNGHLLAYDKDRAAHFLVMPRWYDDDERPCPCHYADEGMWYHPELVSRDTLDLATAIIQLTA